MDILELIEQREGIREKTNKDGKKNKITDKLEDVFVGGPTSSNIKKDTSKKVLVKKR